MLKRLLPFLFCMATCHVAQSQSHHRPNHRRMAFTTDTLMVHDPVMAYERGTYYLLSTGMGISWATSKDRKTWVVQPTPFIENLPKWTQDSVPGFRNHVWAPDLIRWNNRWWLTYSCSTFGKNTSAIGLMSAGSLSGQWRDEGCLVRSEEKRDNWNAIDSNIAIDDDGHPWMVWGSFWDGIQLARLELRTASEASAAASTGVSPLSALCSAPKTIARRYKPGDPNAAENPTSKYAGRNAIEAPFIFKKNGYYYLFVAWDYCCRGPKSNYRVAVGRSKKIEGPYLDRTGKPMTEGGGTLFLEGDKREYEAAGHCAAYTFGDDDLFICHGYSARMNGASILIQRKIAWDDGWPVLQ